MMEKTLPFVCFLATAHLHDGKTITVIMIHWVQESMGGSCQSV
jgi:hypothetical protein